PALAGVPPARRDLIDRKKYILPNTAQTTRGCPFDCAYCSVTTFFGHTYRTRPVQDVVDEILQMPPGLLVLIDDNIMGNPRYARELFARLKDAKRKWFSQASVTMLRTPDLVAQAAEAGCVVLFVGLETLSERNLQAVGKRINAVEEYRKLVHLLHDHGIAMVASFMFGLDDDTPDVFDRTVEFAIDARIDAALMSILTPLPGTRLYAELEQQGRIFDRDWSHYDGAHATFRPAKMTPDQLVEGLIRAVRNFYSGWSIVKRMFQPLGLSLLYWVMNLIWRRYAINWADGRERAALAATAAEGAPGATE
ncbi:MAG: radical SAM protein, partial [Armatimonadetes bacterium]|nr:radical SAM protein [Armatimonadota bacterium]